MAHATSKDPNVFLLPDLGEGLAEAELIKWRVSVGQHVNELEVLAEMETDKALVEVTSPRSGTIAELHGEPGEVLKVGSPLVVYAGGSANGAKAPAKTESAHTPAPKAAPAQEIHIPEPAARTEDSGTVVGDMSGGAAGVTAAPGKALATPAVRRLAKDLGVDIDAVRGTGIGGRVLEKDVRNASGAAGSAGTGSGAVGTSVSPARSTPAPAARAPIASARTGETPAPRAPQSKPLSAPLPPSADEITRIPFRGVRRTIASRLRESVDQAVHFTVMDEADVSTLDTLRRKLAAASGEKLSFLPFVASAVCRVLAQPQFRALNATVDEKAGDAGADASIIQHRSVHLGIATDTESGLMVPVIRDADRLGVLEIGRSITQIAEQARSRTIARENLMGGTFTISNVGSHAGRFATPVINYPEVAILAVGRARPAPVVRHGGIFVGNLLPLSLACDHRVVDGATAALALAEIIKLLQESPESVMGPARG